MEAPVIYQHPLAYLLGLEGVALLRAFSGVYDQDFTLARFREIQALPRRPAAGSRPGQSAEHLVVARPGHGRHEHGLARKAGRDHLALPALC
jgi:hypothetical protein